ncbi:histidine phosphatase superfamily [Aspergillus avenaceus]|uniref:Histidine phosphatase superfamily n=1 Tax=Aspergillus avenaceus TaxID=36643 RepID=A0A5N6TT51_ASPAV|nr:histidine phosphatase superfamily [Aspergillus avenaceus]
MPPVIHCVRHAQGVHNLCTANHVIHDPLLTDLGNEQCRQLRENFPSHDKVELVTASPLRRTMYTALQSFGPVFEAHKDTKLILLPEVQEISDVACDTGSDPDVLRKEIEENGLPVDSSLVYEGWNVKTGRYLPTHDAIRNRAREARRWLKARPEKEIVVVTHGGFLHYFTEDWEDSSQYQGTGWVNTEYRTYEFTSEIHKTDLEGRELESDNATMVETTPSRERRGKEGPAPDRETQKSFYKIGTKGWDDQGLQLSEAEREAAKVSEGKEVDGSRV